MKYCCIALIMGRENTNYFSIYAHVPSHRDRCVFFVQRYEFVLADFFDIAAAVHRDQGNIPDFNWLLHGDQDNVTIMEARFHTIPANRNTKIGTGNLLRLNQDFLKTIRAQIGACTCTCGLRRYLERNI